MSSKDLPQIILFHLQITLSSNYMKFLTFSNYFSEMGVWLKFVNVSEQPKLLLLALLDIDYQHADAWMFMKTPP